MSNIDTTDEEYFDLGRKSLFTELGESVLKIVDYTNSIHLVDTSAQDAIDYAKDKNKD